MALDSTVLPDGKIENIGSDRASGSEPEPAKDKGGVWRSEQERGGGGGL